MLCCGKEFQEWFYFNSSNFLLFKFSSWFMFAFSVFLSCCYCIYMLLLTYLILNNPMYKILSCREVSREFLYVSLSVFEIIFFALFWDRENKTNQNREYTSDLYSTCISLVAFLMHIWQWSFYSDISKLSQNLPLGPPRDHIWSFVGKCFKKIP